MTPLYTLKEAAALLGMSPDTLRGYLDKGEISYIALGHGRRRIRRRFDIEDLERFKARQRRTDEWPSTSPVKGLRPGGRSSGTKVISLDGTLAQRIDAMRKG